MRGRAAAARAVIAREHDVWWADRPPDGVAEMVGAAVSMTYDSVCTASALPALSTEKNFSVVVAVMEWPPVYDGELVVGVEPSGV